MRFTKKELKRIIQEEYQKVLKEYISEDAAQFAQQQNKAGKGPSDTKALNGMAMMKVEEALKDKENCGEISFDVQAALDTLSSALGLATSGGDESSPHPGGEPDIYAMMDEGEGEEESSQSSFKGEDPRTQAFRQAISLLDELTYDSLERDVASDAKKAKDLLSKAARQLDFNRNEVGNPGNVEED